MENGGAKGHPSERILKDETKVLADYKGAGVIRRIWMTFGGLTDKDEGARILAGVKIQMYWDGVKEPAVDVPLGMFFTVGNHEMRAFESKLFASPEARSLVCCIPMPFSSSVKIQLVNETGINILHLFYSVDMTVEKVETDMRFHAIYHAPAMNELRKDVVIMKTENQMGRFLGICVNVGINKDYGNTWFGESEVKVYLDGDRDYPTLASTGTEDYIGTAWGQGEFCNHYSGCLEMDDYSACFYRFHIPDPVFFKSDCKVVIQTIGGSNRKTVCELLEKGVALCPTTSDIDGIVHHLYGKDIPWDKIPADKNMNFYRRDTYETVAYCYLA